MPDYRITLARTAEKELARLPDHVQRRTIRMIDLLAENPLRSGCKKLKGPHQVYRARVGDYRIVYEIDHINKVVDVVRIRHRREAYD